MIPTTIPATMAALDDAFDGLGEAEATALTEALAHISPVRRIVSAFGVLKQIETPPDAGLIALAGCARVLVQHGFNGLALEAAEELTRRDAQIAALPQPVIVLPESGP